MNISFLHYYKMILEKESFDPQLLAIEFEKAIKTMENHEQEIPIEWMKNIGIQIETINLINSGYNKEFY